MINLLIIGVSVSYMIILSDITAIIKFLWNKTT